MRGQITVFILIGIMVVVAFAMTLYAGSRLGLGGKGLKEGERAGVSEIEDAVRSCLNIALGEGLARAGRQGGIIFSDEGGVFPREGFDFLGVPSAGGIVETPFIVLPPQGDVGGLFFADVPLYPFDGFPFPPNEEVPFLTGYYGISRLPPLYRVSEGESVQNSVQAALESFVAQKSAECMDWASFAQEGLEVSAGQPSVVLLFAQRQDQFVGEQFVTAQLTWPLEVETPGLDKVVLTDFSVRVPVRLASVYYVAKSIVDGDVTDVTYVPSPQGGMQVEEITVGDDSVIKVSDPQSAVQGVPFSFWIARKNRVPGLWHIDEAPLERVVFHVAPEGRGTRVTVDGNFLRFSDPCPEDGVPSPFVVELNASDPDEDAVRFEVQVVGSVQNELNEIGERRIRVFAGDGSGGPSSRFDSQELKVGVALCPVR